MAIENQLFLSLKFSFSLRLQSLTDAVCQGRTIQHNTERRDSGTWCSLKGTILVPHQGTGGSMKALRSIAIFLIAFCALDIAYGQSQEGRILGTVTDQSGGLVKGAHVTITNVDTGVARTLETNDAGDYVAPSLPPGLYKLVVEATGFKKVERGGIRLEVAKDLRLDVTMQPGSVSEVVEVTEQVPLVETTNDTLGGTFANKSINDLPLNGRDFQNLVILRPGVQRTTGGGFLSISSNGNRPEDNNFIVDGTDNNDPYYG